MRLLEYLKYFISKQHQPGSYKDLKILWWITESNISRQFTHSYHSLRIYIITAFSLSSYRIKNYKIGLHFELLFWMYWNQVTKFRIIQTSRIFLVHLIKWNFVFLEYILVFNSCNNTIKVYYYLWIILNNKRQRK